MILKIALKKLKKIVHGRRFQFTDITLKLAIVATIIAIIPSYLLAQNSNVGTIQGKIKTSTGELIPGINIILEGTLLGSATNEQGFFQIHNIPPGRYTLVASGVGFSAQKQNINIEAGKISELDLQVSESQTELEEIVVTAANSNYYTANNTTTLATRMPMKVFETPQQIQVIGRKVMNDQQAQTLADVFRNSSGVSTARAYGGSWIRGFEIGQNNYLYNGQRGGLTAATIVPFLVHIESVEILKGASGVLFGEGGLGGTINMVTKKPLEDRRYEVSLTGGSFNTYRATVDAGGAISKDKKLLYRLNIGYEDAKSYTDYFYNKSLIVAPALLYKASNKTEIEWNASYLNDDRNVSYQNGIPGINGNIFALPRNFTVNDPDDFGKHNNFQTQFGVKHKFSEKLVLNALYNYGTSSWNTNSWGTADVDEATGTIERYRENYRDQQQPYHYANIFANYAFETGKIKHSFVLGYDFNQLSNIIPLSYTTDVNTPLDAFNPQYNSLTKEEKEALFTYGYGYNIKEKSNAGYLQYLFNWNAKLNILLGGRFQQYGYKSIETLRPNSPDEQISENESDVNVFIPRIGLSYTITNSISLFAGFNQGFRPQSSNAPLSGGPFPAEIGNQYEVGAKSNFFDGKFNATVSLYQITKNNVLTRDPSDITGRRRLAIGQVESKGVELDIVGNLTSQWKMIANFSYNHVEITKSNNESEVGQRFSNTIPVLANVWTTYKFDNILNGFKIGAGLNYSDKRLILIDPKLEAPAYTLLNATVGYENEKFGVDVNVNNITNVDYVFGTQTYWAANINRGAPTNILATIRYRF